jgi:hypothetical protein
MVGKPPRKHISEAEMRQEERNRADELLFASVLLNRFEPLPPHLVGAIRERLGYAIDEDLREFVRTGRKGG